MKKILSIFIFLLLLVGCSLSNTPTSKVEDLLNKYQRLDSDIEKGIDTVVGEESLTGVERDRYKKIIEKQYKNLTYQIKDETYNGDVCTVTTEIEVLDYKKIINEVNNNYQNKNYTKEEYNNEKLDKLEKTKDNVKYTIDFKVKKENNNWTLEALDDDTIKKIQGTY